MPLSPEDAAGEDLTGLGAWVSAQQKQGAILVSSANGNGQVPPDGERYDLQRPIQPVTEVIDRARRLATIKVSVQEIVMCDVPVSENPYSLLQQVNAALAQSCQPFVAGWELGSHFEIDSEAIAA